MNISKTSAYKRARAGIAYVPQGHGIFPKLTVHENLTIGALINEAQKEEAYDRIYNYFPRLGERHNQMGEIVQKVSSDLGLTVMMIEQHLGLIQQISQRGYVMDKEQINDESYVTKFLSV